MFSLPSSSSLLKVPIIITLTVIFHNCFILSVIKNGYLPQNASINLSIVRLPYQEAKGIAKQSVGCFMLEKPCKLFRSACPVVLVPQPSVLLSLFTL